MASIVDSFREVFGDHNSFIKVFVMSLPVAYSYYLYSTGNYALYSTVSAVTIFFLFGFLAEVTGNVVNERDMVLPQLNPFKLARTAFKGILAIGPLTFIVSMIVNAICAMINIIFWLDIVLKSGLWLVAASIIITSFLMFVEKEKIFDAYKLKVVFAKAGDLIITLLVFVLQLTVINIPTSFFLGYTISVLFGMNSVVFALFVCYALVFNIGVTGHYLAQVHYEVLDFKKEIL